MTGLTNMDFRGNAPYTEFIINIKDLDRVISSLSECRIIIENKLALIETEEDSRNSDGYSLTPLFENISHIRYMDWDCEGPVHYRFYVNGEKNELEHLTEGYIETYLLESDEEFDEEQVYASFLKLKSPLKIKDTIFNEYSKFDSKHINSIMEYYKDLLRKE